MTYRSDPLTVRSYDAETATMGDVEDRAGVDRLSTLLAERQAIVDKLATLRPKYGPLGLSDKIRKVELARIAVMLRAQYTEKSEKVSEARLDEEAHAHSDYAALIAHATTEAAEWVRLEETLEAIDYRIFRGHALLRFAAMEPK
jgi:hypothetical protein